MADSQPASIPSPDPQPEPAGPPVAAAAFPAPAAEMYAADFLIGETIIGSGAPEQ